MSAVTPLLNIKHLLKLIKIPLLTAIALVAFAGNSVLCRLALEQPQIDAGSFTLVRLVAGAVTLLLLVLLSALVRFMREPRLPAHTIQHTLKAAVCQGRWVDASWLFIYAVGFSYAYIVLGAGMGALILFGCVQVTLVCANLLAGQRLFKRQWLGLAIAFVGFSVLVMPGQATVHWLGFLSMGIAGVAWGLYTLAGRKTALSATTLSTSTTSTKATATATVSTTTQHNANAVQGNANPAVLITTGNFLRASVMGLCALPLLFTPLWQVHFSAQGLGLAVVAGAITSGMGYAVWYAVLPALSVLGAGILQLLVPLIAVVGGVIFVHEPITLPLLLAASMILGGILLVTLKKP